MASRRPRSGTRSWATLVLRLTREMRREILAGFRENFHNVAHLTPPLVERLAGMGIANVDSGTVYRALRRLNDEGLVSSSWEEVAAGPARRRYSVTPAGVASLDDCTSTVVATSRSLGFFLARHRRLAGRAMHASANR